MSRRSIRAVFRVQCGKCNGWLSVPSVLPWGRKMENRDLVTRSTPGNAATFQGERAARSAARYAGWVPDPTKEHGSGVLLCPGCKDNPLGIMLPPQCPDCGHVHLGRTCSEFHCLCGIKRKN